MQIYLIQKNQVCYNMKYLKRFENKDLINASRTGDLDKVKELIKAGANVDIQNINGNTALILASINDKLDLCDLVLKDVLLYNESSSTYT